MMLAKLLSALHRPIYDKRLEVLVETISPHLEPGDKVLDVGCGSGALGAALLKANGAKNLVVHGLEKHRRGGEPIQVVPYDEKQFPFTDNSYDAVIVADVLHHEEEPEQLLRECIRVSRRLLVIKDHQITGPLAYERICLIDWAANAPYGVRCLYRYKTPQEWSACLEHLLLEPVQRLDRMNLYPPVVNLLFGRSLQFLAIGNVSNAKSGERGIEQTGQPSSR